MKNTLLQKSWGRSLHLILDFTPTLSLCLCEDRSPKNRYTIGNCIAKLNSYFFYFILISFTEIKIFVKNLALKKLVLKRYFRIFNTLLTIYWIQFILGQKFKKMSTFGKKKTKWSSQRPHASVWNILVWG